MTVVAKLLLSLSKRERIKVRDFLCFARRERTRSPAKRYRVPRGFDDSKTARRESLFRRGIFDGPRPLFLSTDNYAHLHPAQLQVLRLDSRHRERKDRLDADAEIYSPQNFGFADYATEFFPRPSLCCVDNERGSSSRRIRKALRCGDPESRSSSWAPHLNPLPAAGRGRPAIDE
jgi:hypothetical protein